MDGVHDLGGQQGFGPVVHSAAAAVFHEDWEKRMRVKEQIAWADAHGVIEKAEKFLRGLSADEWER